MRFIFRVRYGQDIDLFKHKGQVFWYGLLLLAVFLAPLGVSTFLLGELSLVCIWGIAGLGLMVLVGYTGLVSLGHAAFLAVGAYAQARLMHAGVPLPVALLGATGISAGVGALVGLSALRMTGVYLAIATLAVAAVVEQILARWEFVTNGLRGLPVPKPELFGFQLGDAVAFYYLCLTVFTLSALAVLNLLRSSTGRSFIAVRDSEISAQAMGVNLFATKTTAFALSAGLTGLAGGLFAHKIGYLFPDSFDITTSIMLLMMVVVGGLGSMHGVVFGAIFVGMLPQGLAIVRDFLPQAWTVRLSLEPFLFGAILVLCLVFEPLGIHGRWIKIRQYFSHFPLHRRATFKKQKSYLRSERVH